MNKIKLLLGAMTFTAAVLAWAQNIAAATALQPVNLRCDERVNPLGIGDLTPRLSWQLQSGNPAANRGETQASYEIIVGSTPGGSDLWDSGVISSANTKT